TGLLRDDRNPRLLNIKSLDVKSQPIAPLAYFLRSVTVTVRRPIPIEVDVIVLSLGEFRPVVELAEVPVDEALQVVTTLADPEMGNIFRNVARCCHLAERDPEPGERQQRLPGLLIGQPLNLRANMIV